MFIFENLSLVVNIIRAKVTNNWKLPWQNFGTYNNNKRQE